MDNELITIKQLPVIEEQLKSIQIEIQKKVDDALSLECNEDTVKTVKALRAELNKNFAELEERRIFVKNKILEPYEQFSEIYKECITNVFQNADAELKSRVDDVENGIKSQKREEIKRYFCEYCEASCVDFVDFEASGIKVTLSASPTALKQQAKEFIDRVKGDLALINTQPFKTEILIEYKKSLNVSDAITKVLKRQEEIRKEQENVQRSDMIAEEKERTVQNVEATAAALSAPKEVKTKKMTFTVRASMDKLTELKKYLIKNGYEIL